ncbi:aspartate-semialdehyde dehydrogenase [Sulfobacillus harzensis]|uniref:Aspartate-semialdehyde dehydrogenase n=1 Tax=Sulfobacillus harzensis TaxID=2729629 RepID=A0A7Y0L213_9FIRM|nr:aspartate-semialdehyde dehydrogenase [Sulfobacillus harzensis]NMP21848.1 aspartate-semialdehyde dehydrogenase [Sulfobacillus harzensis]
MSGYRIAIVGATGLVGQTLLKVLEDKALRVDALVALAREGGGRSVTFHGRSIPVEPLEEMDWTRVDVAFFAAGNAVSEAYAPRAMEQGVTVIDKSSRFRMDDRVPLVVPEVNREAIGDSRLIASPNCSTIQLVIALAPLEWRFGIDRVVVSTYQAVSGTGREAVEELEHEVQQAVAGQAVTPQVYPVPIAHNVLAFCDNFGEADYTGEEWKLMRESAKILGRDLKLSATAVRVPVYVGHAESVYLETQEPWSIEAVRETLATAPSVRLVDDPSRGLVPTPLDAAGHDDVLVGRIRRDPHHPRGLHLFVVADNLRRGAATNAIDIMRTLSSRWGIEEGDDQ